MRFFNLDLHISVIRDVADIFQSLGHEVDDISMSDHTRFADKTKRSMPPLDNPGYRHLDDKAISLWADRYADSLKRYDGFIVTHTPSFALLYERFDKPIVVVNSTRYEHPFENKPLLLNRLKKLLRSDQVILVANNRYDVEYTHAAVGRRPLHIESLCRYVMHRWVGGAGEAHELPRPWTWDQLVRYDAVHERPYNFSVMSWFERAWAGIPMVFPSLDTLAAGGYFQQRSWFPDSPYPDIKQIKLSDFYTFKCASGLGDYAERSQAQLDDNRRREQVALEAWSVILGDIR
ncbi:MAG: hypothetical protein GC162_20415 [Planctomycetes bacterium]|nr:hypothetical protein [Planctomycetota bacterium]